MYKSFATGALVFAFVFSAIAKPTEYTEKERVALEKVFFFQNENIKVLLSLSSKNK
jgi:hypothetical protein